MSKDVARAARTDSQMIEPSTLAWLLATAGNTRVPCGSGGRHALDAMIASHPPAQRAHDQLHSLAADAGMEDVVATDPTTVCAAHREYEQLIELGERSGWCAAGDLTDPDGWNGANLTPYLRIAKARAAREAGGSGKGVEQRVVAWLARAAEVEDSAEGGALRAASQLERWPFNATGAMDRVGNADLPMILGSLSPAELHFRADMARVRRALARAPDDLRDAHRRLLRLIESARNQSLRMSGLVLAGLARLLLTHVTVRGHALPGREEASPGPVARLMLASAERALRRSDRATELDHRGLEAIHVAIVTIEVESAAVLGDQREHRVDRRAGEGASLARASRGSGGSK